MTQSYHALTTDHYINQKIGLKMELAQSRETVLELFDRISRQFTKMDQFRKYKDELALESSSTIDGEYLWMAIRSNSIRSGAVNPGPSTSGFDLHKLILQVAPYYLSISPLDVDYIELLFGFDLAAKSNHNEIVMEALLGGSPLADLHSSHMDQCVDCQPTIGFSLENVDQTEAHFEIKTRNSKKSRDVEYASESRAEPISVYLTVRRYGPVRDIKNLPEAFDTLAATGQDLVETCAVPRLLIPLRETIISFGG